MLLTFKEVFMYKAERNFNCDGLSFKKGDLVSAKQAEQMANHVDYLLKNGFVLLVQKEEIKEEKKSKKKAE